MIIVTSTAEEGEAAASEMTGLIEVTTEFDDDSISCSTALFTDSTKFADDIHRIAADGEPTIVIGTLRRVTDLIRRGALSTISLTCLVLIASDKMIGTSVARTQNLQHLFQHIDSSTTRLVLHCATVTDDVEQLADNWPGEWRWLPSDPEA